MIRSKDLVLLCVTLGSIALGALFPTVGRPFAALPKYFMMVLLFLSFTSVRINDVAQTLRLRWGDVLFLTALKLLALPVLAYVMFKAILPEYAVAALLLSGVSTGVVSPFFGDMLEAETPLLMVVLVLTSMLVPFTLPLLAALLLGRSMTIPLSAMIQLLAMVIFLPLLAVETLRRLRPDLIGPIEDAKYPLSLLLFALTNLGIFSGYSEFFRAAVSSVLLALLAALILGALYFLVGVAVSWNRPAPYQVSTIIAFGIMNNILVIVFGSEFFGPLEPTVAAMYTIPFFSLVVPMRMYRGWSVRRARTGS